MKYNINTPIVISEIGCNHLGSMELAKKQIDLSIEANVDIIKFQKRCPKELLTPEEYNAPHPNPEFSYGSTYGLHREFLEFTLDQHKELKEYIESKNKIYSTSVWDMTSTKEIISLNPKIIKIPSATNLNFKIAEVLCNEFPGDIFISLGMTTQKEEEDIVNFYCKKNRNTNIILFHCISGYPVPFNKLCLLEIVRLKNKFKNDVKDFGFSNHGYGIAIDISAFTLGARLIERHFTSDRCLRHTDCASSLELSGMKKLVRNLNATYESLTYRNQDILDIEEVQRKKLKFNSIKY